jgi:hypothetical protein
MNAERKIRRDDPRMNAKRRELLFNPGDLWQFWQSWQFALAHPFRNGFQGFVLRCDDGN